MNKEKLKSLWKKYDLSCRNSYAIEHIKKFCNELGINFNDKWIYKDDRYREVSNGKPRIDAEDLLIDVCKELNIEPDQDRLEYSKRYYGEGSRRECIEKAYLF